MIVADTDDPEARALHQWASVLSQWLSGDPEPLAVWLLDPATELQDDARAFLADLVRGKVKRPRGRRTRKRGGEERAIVAEVFIEYERQAKKSSVLNPHERAIAVVANRRGLLPGAVRGIVEKLAAAGINATAWRQWGRPVWTT